MAQARRRVCGCVFHHAKEMRGRASSALPTGARWRQQPQGESQRATGKGFSPLGAVQPWDEVPAGCGISSCGDAQGQQRTALSILICPLGWTFPQTPCPKILFEPPHPSLGSPWVSFAPQPSPAQLPGEHHHEPGTPGKAQQGGVHAPCPSCSGFLHLLSPSCRAHFFRSNRAGEHTGTKTPPIRVSTGPGPLACRYSPAKFAPASSCQAKKKTTQRWLFKATDIERESNQHTTEHPLPDSPPGPRRLRADPARTFPQREKPGGCFVSSLPSGAAKTSRRRSEVRALEVNPQRGRAAPPHARLGPRDGLAGDRTARF